jgi:hypothetical protein
MKTHKIMLTSVLLALACFASSPIALARPVPTPTPTPTATPLLGEDRGNGNSAAENVDALNLSTTGSNNTAHGWSSLHSNTTCSYNTADGNLTLYLNTIGYNNTAAGYGALLNNTGGFDNTANGVLALWLDGWNLKTGAFGILGRDATADISRLSGKREALSVAAAYLSYFALSMGLVRWWKFADRRRKSWFSLFPVLAAGFWAVLLMAMLELDGPHFLAGQGAAAAIVTAAAVVQFVSPHDPPAPSQPRRLRYRAA